MKLTTILKEAKSTRLIGLLKQGAKATKNMGEDKLLKLSDAFEKLDNEQADDIAGDLNMAIENMQDGYAKDATGWLKKFNKECKKALKESISEGILSEGYKKSFNSIKNLEAAILKITDAKTIRVVLEVGYEIGYSEQYIFPQSNKDWKNKVKSSIKELEKNYKTTTWNGKPAPSPKWYLEEKGSDEYITYVRHKFQDKHGRSRYGGR